ncbi:MAG TPA: YceD family protein, partial [Sphingomonadales bacterium]|nr:YceD family protein [Sphingomonadales bacterium]
RTCVRTLDPMPEVVDEPFEVRLVERGLYETMGEGRDEEPIDIEVIEGEIFDLGELSAQYLSLLMDPYPRSAKAEAMAPLGEEEKEEAGPFAALKKLRKKP